MAAIILIPDVGNILKLIHVSVIQQCFHHIGWICDTLDEFGL